MREKGFTLFVAVMVAGTLALIAMGIAALAVRESAIATSVRDSEAAFYAADTGAECALYWDIVGYPDFSNPPYKRSEFASTTANGSAWSPPFTCNRDTANLNNNTPVTHIYSNGYSTSGPFAVRFAPDPYCAEVTVVKKDDGSTKIESLGFNTSSGNSRTSCGTGGRRVERAVRVTY